MKKSTNQTRMLFVRAESLEDVGETALASFSNFIRAGAGLSPSVWRARG